jgi:Leucine-rich repeat (LRR) protein
MRDNAQPTGTDAADILELVLQHLNSTHHRQPQQQQQPRAVNAALQDGDYQAPLSRPTVRALHPISRSLCSSVRATRTYLSLTNWARQLQYAHLYQLMPHSGSRWQAMAPDDPRWIPWQLLAAAPAVSSLKVELQQLAPLLMGPPQVLADLTKRLTALEVAAGWRKYTNNYTRNDTSDSSQAQVECLGRLLAQCHGLQVLCVHGCNWLGPEHQSSEPALATSGGGSSISSSSRPRPPLLRLELAGVPFAPFFARLQQRGQLGQLRYLGLESLQQSDFDRVEWTSLTGLEGLKLVGARRTLEPMAMQLPCGLAASCSSLKHVSIVRFSGGIESTLRALTGLQRLELLEVRGTRLNCSWLSALRQLTHLDLTSSMVDLPEDLGQGLPGLEVLVVVRCGLWVLPTGLSRLSRLDAAYNHGLQADSLAALCDATALRQLNLSACGLRLTQCLSVLTQLEVLELCGRDPLHGPDEHPFRRGPARRHGAPRQGRGGLPRAPPPSSMPHAANLRRLDLSHGDWPGDSLAALRGLQHLTHLDLNSGLRRGQGKHLTSLGVLPALQQLDLSRVVIDNRDWTPVGAWLGQQPKLTRLLLEGSMQANLRAGAGQLAQGLAQLPTQLVALNLRYCGLQQLPTGLSRLTNLQVLLAGAGNVYTTLGLPGWVTLLQALEVLEVGKVDPPRGEGAAVLLQQLSRLRELNVDPVWCPIGVYEEPGLCLYRMLPHLSRVS